MWGLWRGRGHNSWEGPISSFEKYSLLISVVGLASVIAGLIFAGIQLRSTKAALRADHDWNRRLAAQQALRDFDTSFLSAEFRKRFDYLNSQTPISKSECDTIRSDPDFEAQILKLLNCYESLARGVFQEIFDEEVIIAAVKTSMIRCESYFMAYIEYRRKEVNSNAWKQLSYLIVHWKEDRSIIKRSMTA